MNKQDYILLEQAYNTVISEGNEFNIEKRYYLNIKPSILKRAVSTNYFTNDNVIKAQQRLESFNNPIPDLILDTKPSPSTIPFKDIQSYFAGVFRDAPKYGITPQDLLSNYKTGKLTTGAKKIIKIENITTNNLIKFHDWITRYFINTGLIIYLTQEEWEKITGKGESAIGKVAKGVYGGLVGFGKSW